MDTGESLAPRPLTIDRLGERDELIVAQSTSQCCRCCCFQPSINWVIAEGNNFVPGTNPYELDTVAWIHEESSFCGRWWSWILPGCRETKYVQHSGPAPASIRGENQGWFTCQCEKTTSGLEETDRQSNIVAIHEKNCTCGTCWMWPIPFPICNCCPLPYLETKSGVTGQLLGKTVYICDICCFVPKYDVFDELNQKKYRIRPDTCVGGLCVRCRCDGKGGKCCRVPFLIRNPKTTEILEAGPNVINRRSSSIKAMIDVLWSGWKHECCTQKNAYHLVFPSDIRTEEKLVLLGSTVLVDVTMFEQDDGNDGG